MYHRVAKLHHDPWDLAVSPEVFDEQLAYLKRHHTLMRLDELAEAMRGNKLPHNAVAITFDDGYRDNLACAKPLLLHHGVPATVFLSTGWVGSDVPFWWDELAAMILGSDASVRHLQTIEDHDVHLVWGEPDEVDRSGAWRALDPPRTARQKAYLETWRKIRNTSQAERTRVMSLLRDRFPIKHDPLSLPMHAAEVQELIAGDLISLGAHTVHHPALTQLGSDECRNEIVASAEQCRAFTGSNILSFAYPYGDMDGAVRSFVVDAGYSLACSTRAATLTPDTQDRFALPRMAIPNCTIRQFARMLSY